MGLLCSRAAGEGSGVRENVQITDISYWCVKTSTQVVASWVNALYDEGHIDDPGVTS